MKMLKAAVVGAGWVSGEHAAAFKANPKTDLVAVCSRTRASAEGMLARCGCEARVYDDYAAMLAKEKPDIVSICTPNHLHAEETILGARAGAHMIIEKPAALSEKELSAMLAAVKKARVRTLVSFVLHWNPLLMIIDRLLNDDAVGDIYYAEVDYYHGIGPWYKQYLWNVKKEIGGSSLLSAGCHAVDALLWFMRKKPVEVFSYGVRSVNKSFDKYEYDPTSVTMVRFADGSVGKVTSSIDCTTPYIFNIGLFGAKGAIRNNRVFSHKMAGQTDYATIPTVLPDSGDVVHHPFEGEVNHLVDCIESGARPFPDLEHAAVTHRLIFAADRSARTGRPVKL